MADRLADSEQDRSAVVAHAALPRGHDGLDANLLSEGLIYLVDDDVTVLQVISRLLREADYEVRAFRSPANFLQRHDARAAGCAVFGLTMAGLSGLDLHRHMRARGDARPTVFIAGDGDVSSSVQAMKAGAVDVLTKPVCGEGLIAAVRAAVERDRFDRSVQDEIEAVAQRASRLTPREREVMDHVVIGRLNKQIAAAMRISLKTVKVHRARVMTKMAVRSLPDLVRLTDHMSALESFRPLPPQDRNLRHRASAARPS